MGRCKHMQPASRAAHCASRLLCSFLQASGSTCSRRSWKRPMEWARSGCTTWSDPGVGVDWRSRSSPGNAGCVAGCSGRGGWARLMPAAPPPAQSCMMRSGPEAQLTRSVGLGRSLGRRRSQNALEGASRRGVVDLWQIASSQSGRVYSNFNAICCPPPSTLLHCTAQSPRTRFARAVMRSNPNFEPDCPPAGSNRSLFCALRVRQAICTARHSW